ncbi:hypothetical protein KC19_1G018700 [Ceratodon purpureus]|uniref:Uncharacterized protein n=1 Tax=Ceratodon purpureus TaxID=3225 RepID=A0A8T0J2W7_CERPU|nr:hypothetical protein KC19_1G018700 [Ceratodon purpureus]
MVMWTITWFIQVKLVELCSLRIWYKAITNKVTNSMVYKARIIGTADIQLYCTKPVQ